MSSKINKPKTDTSCTATKGISCVLNKPIIKPCTNVKQIAVQCNLSKPFCKPAVKQKHMCLPKPVCSTVKQKLTLLPEKKEENCFINKPNCICSTVKEVANVPIKKCTNVNPQFVCLNQPSKKCTGVKPFHRPEICETGVKPSAIKTNHDMEKK
jgi:hypothetical protein